MMTSLRFSALPKVGTYAKPTKGNGSPHLRMYETQPEGFPHPWYFVHRDNAPQGGVATVTVLENEKGEQVVRLLKIKRPPLGGKITLELPAGLWEKNESQLTCAKREVREETGYDVTAAKMLTEHNLPNAQGISSELTSFALALVKGEKKGKDMREESEKSIIIGKLDVPIAVFADSTAFSKWLAEVSKQDYMVSREVFVARALMPPLTNGKLTEKAFEATA